MTTKLKVKISNKNDEIKKDRKAEKCGKIEKIEEKEKVYQETFKFVYIRAGFDIFFIKSCR